MSERLHVRPGFPGAIVRDPHTRRRLPAAGGHVPDNTYWRRRLREGDVILVVPEPSKAFAPAREQKGKE